MQLANHNHTTPFSEYMHDKGGLRGGGGEGGGGGGRVMCRKWHWASGWLNQAAQVAATGVAPRSLATEYGWQQTLHLSGKC